MHFKLCHMLQCGRATLAACQRVVRAGGSVCVCVWQSMCVRVCVQQCLHLVAAFAPLAFQRLYANCSGLTALSVAAAASVSVCCPLPLPASLLSFKSIKSARCSWPARCDNPKLLPVGRRRASLHPSLPRQQVVPVVRNNFHINVNSSSR